MIKAIVFDCFGVLVGQGFSRTYGAAGGDAARDRKFIHKALSDSDLGKISQEEFGERIASRLGISVERWNEITDQEEQLNTQLVEYIAGSLKPHYKIGLLSNANRGLVETKIPEDIVENLFDSVVISADVGMMKPDPAMFKYAAGDLGVELEEIIFIDDIALFVDAASALGIKTIHYQNFEQCKAELTKLLKE